MNTETITAQHSNQLPKSNRKWWVKFSKNNGRILTLTPREIKDYADTELVVQVDNPICRDILKGTANKNNYAILWDYKSEEWKLDVKSTTLVMRPRDNKLVPIQTNKSPDICDMYLKVFKNENTILVSVDLKNIAETMNLADIHFISSEDESHLLNIFLTRKNDPDYLITSIPISAEELIKEEKLLIELPEDVVKLIDWENTSVYTKPIFSTYGMEYSNSQVKTISEKNFLVIRKSTATPEFCDINICIVNGKLEIKSSLAENQIYYFKGKTKFNLLVSDAEIDRFVGNIELNTAKLCSKDVHYIPIPDFWPDRPILTFKSKYATVSYTGEQDAH
jgi:hypothetical protein